MVVSTYTVLTSEHKNLAIAGPANVSVKKKAASKSKARSEDDDDDERPSRRSNGGSDSDDSLFGKSLKGSKASTMAGKKGATRAVSGKGKEKACALFGVRFWRVVLGKCLGRIFAELTLTNTTDDPQTRLTTSRTERAKLPSLLSRSTRSTDGFSLVHLSRFVSFVCDGINQV